MLVAYFSSTIYQVYTQWAYCDIKSLINSLYGRRFIPVTKK